jgi:hypothetical protein
VTVPGGAAVDVECREAEGAGAVADWSAQFNSGATRMAVAAHVFQVIRCMDPRVAVRLKHRQPGESRLPATWMIEKRK